MSTKEKKIPDRVLNFDKGPSEPIQSNNPQDLKEKLPKPTGIINHNNDIVAVGLK